MTSDEPPDPVLDPNSRRAGFPLSPSEGTLRDEWLQEMFVEPNLGRTTLTPRTTRNLRRSRVPSRDSKILRLTGPGKTETFPFIVGTSILLINFFFFFSNLVGHIRIPINCHIVKYLKLGVHVLGGIEWKIKNT